MATKDIRGNKIFYHANNLYYCCNIAQFFTTNDKFLPTKRIHENTVNYIATIL
jgi:hypothetical protein